MDGDESNDVELNRRNEDPTKTFTWARVSKTTVKCDCCRLFLLILMTFAITFLALSILLEIVYPFDSDPDVLYQNACLNLIRFSDLSTSSFYVVMGMVQSLNLLWNAVVYILEHAIFIMIEIVSLISICNRGLFFLVNETDTLFRKYD